MTELKPVDHELPPDVAALARALRDLFAGLGVSTRRYAARRSYDSSTVSRYLSGNRMPPWEFVLNLLHDVAEERGTVPTEETIGMLRGLHTAALHASSSPAHKVQLLERKLAEADQEARRAAARERWLEDALQDREHRVRDLQMRYRELQASAVPPPSPPADEPPAGTPTDEAARLRAEVHELKEELSRVRALHQQAEERCAQLERQLAEAEAGTEPEDVQRDVPGGVPGGASRGTAGEGVEWAGAPVPGPEVVPYATVDGGPFAREGAPAGFAADADVHNQVVAAPGAPPVTSVYQFGHVHGSVTVNTDDWQVDEELVARVSVRICDGDDHLGNGLLVDAETVITSGGVLSWARNASGKGAKVVVGGDRVRAEPVEKLALPPLALPASRSRRPKVAPLVVLRLAEPVPVPDRPLSYDWRPRPGRQLLVDAHAAMGPYSCLLDVKGRTGDWLRVAGEVVRGLVGAPAFTHTGALAGLLLARGEDGQGGLLLPVAALRALSTVSLADEVPPDEP